MGGRWGRRSDHPGKPSRKAFRGEPGLVSVCCFVAVLSPLQAQAFNDPSPRESATGPSRGQEQNCANCAGSTLAENRPPGESGRRFERGIRCGVRSARCMFTRAAGSELGVRSEPRIPCQHPQAKMQVLKQGPIVHLDPSSISDHMLSASLKTWRAWETRTPDLQIRSLPLYPSELQAHV